MNNAQITNENVDLELDPLVDFQPMLNQQAKELVEIVEALDKVMQSSYWKVLYNKIFSQDLISLRSRLSKERDTTELFRLQGEIARAEKYDLNKMLVEKQNRLQNIKKQMQ